MAIFLRLTGRPRSLVDALSMPGLSSIDFELPRIEFSPRETDYLEMNDILEGYAAAATPDLIARYDSFNPNELYASVLDLLPQIPVRVADIGTGTGRDAAWFGRRVFPISPDKTIEAANGSGFTLVRQSQSESIQPGNRAVGVHWTWLAFWRGTAVLNREAGFQTCRTMVPITLTRMRAAVRTDRLPMSAGG